MSQPSLGSTHSRPLLLIGALATAFLLIFASPGSADFDAASKAYQNQDYGLAYKGFSELAAEGDPRAQTVLGIMYKYGESVEVDLRQSFSWYLKAAEAGYPPALYNVGIMLLEGTGTDQNETAAKEWLQRAAEAGFERAQDKLAEMDGSKLVLHNEEPVVWSKNWNLRIPNAIREQAEPDMMQIYVYRVQVGAMSSLDAAERLWQSLYVNNEMLFGGQQPIFRESRSGEKIVYRIQLGPFDQKQAAEAFCKEYKAHFLGRASCLVIKTI